MKKVAIIAPNSLPVPPVRGGGIQAVISEMAERFRRYKPYVFSICEPGIDDLPLFEVEGNVEHRRIRLTAWQEFKISLLHLSRKSYFPYVHEISKQIAGIKPDVIHVMSRPWFLPILRKYLGRGVKIIEQNHNNYFMEMKRGEVKRYLDDMDAFAGVSRFTVNAEVLDRFPEKKDMCFVIYNGVDTKKFSPASENIEGRRAVRERLSIANDDVVILFSGRLSHAKGVDTLVQAVKRIVPGNKGVKLLVAGSRFFGADNKVTDFMKKLYADAEPVKDNVIFAGFVPREAIQDFYRAADILAVPSHMEAFGLVYAEAGSCGLPSIGTIRGAIPEVIDNNVTGLLMKNPEDVDDLEDKLRFFIDDPSKRAEFGVSARKRIKALFSWDAVVGSVEDMYDRVLKF